jgi:hypothetical protein
VRDYRNGSEQYLVPVKNEEPPLTFGEPTDVGGALHFDAHALERWLVRHWRHD